MISKLIVHGDTREEATKLLHSALTDYKVIGLPTNIKFLKRVLENEDFKQWKFDTSFIAKHEKTLLGNPKFEDLLLAKARFAVANLFLRSNKSNSSNPWATLDNFRVNHPSLEPVIVKDTVTGEKQTFNIKYNSPTNFSVF